MKPTLSGRKRNAAMFSRDSGMKRVEVCMVGLNRQSLDRAAFINQDAAAPLRCGVEVGMGVQHQSSDHAVDGNWGNKLDHRRDVVGHPSWRASQRLGRGQKGINVSRPAHATFRAA